MVRIFPNLRIYYTPSLSILGLSTLDYFLKAVAPGMRGYVARSWSERALATRYERLERQNRGSGVATLQLIQNHRNNSSAPSAINKNKIT